jgi:hypothetical protein
MGVKSFPAGYTDITSTATKILAANADGTTGYKSQRAGGDNLLDITNRGFTTGTPLTISFNAQPITIPNGLSIATGYSVSYIQSTNNSGTIVDLNYNAARHIFSGGSLGIGVNPTEKLQVSGNIYASGSVSGTVFTPTSLRSRKRDIKDYSGDALADINELQLHTYHFREYETIEQTQAVYEEVVNHEGVTEQRLVTPAMTKEVEKISIDQMLNVGVIMDEVANPLIADQDKGVLNLNNIVFLLAKSVQQLTARLEALEVK